MLNSHNELKLPAGKAESKEPPEGFELLNDWAYDGSFDPSSRSRTARYRGRTWNIRNLMGPGWYMSISESPYHIGMVDWENWAQAAAAIDRHLDGAS